MKILYIITKTEIGGAQTHVADLCNYFKSKGHYIAVMSSGNGWLKKECEKMGINFIENKYFSNNLNPCKIFCAIKEIRKYVEEFRPDVVHCHSSVAGFLGRISIRNSIPTVFTAHGWAFDKGTPFSRKFLAIFFEKISAKYCYKIICVSNFTKQEGLKWKIAADKKFEVVYNGIKNIESDSEIKKEIENKIRMVFVGRFSKQKNPLLLLKSLIGLPENIKNSLVVSLVGNGAEKKKIESFIKKQKNLPKIKILSNLTPSEVKLFLSESDIFVLISNWEGFPYTILEAMSAGLPIIASDVGGVGEAVNEQNGILVKNEVGQIRDAILKLVSDEELRLRLGEQGRKDVDEKFSLEKMLNQIEKIYTNI